MPPGQAQKERHRRANQKPRVSLGFKVQLHVRLSFTEQSFVMFGAADPVKHSQGRKGKIKVFIRDLVLISHLAIHHLNLIGCKYKTLPELQAHAASLRLEDPQLCLCGHSGETGPG